MTWKDKLEIGLKDDAAFRRDNLPEFQKSGGDAARKPGDPSRSPQEPEARVDAEQSSYAVAGRRSVRARTKPRTRRTKPAARKRR